MLERVRIAKITGVAFPVFMDHSNIVAMFEMMDTSKKGTISFVQYREGQCLIQIDVIISSYSISFFR